MTRQQRYLRQALEHVRAMRSQTADTQAAYGRLCHKLPVLVRANGLCQTVAFVEDQASGEGSRALAYRLLLDHVRAALEADTGQTLGARDLARAISEAPLGEYIRYTRALLAAWVYYKRFATSILSVSSDTGDEVGV
jgi:CRISPR-associated protein Cmr5